MARAHAAIVVSVVLVAAGATSSAARAQRIDPEVRADAIIAHRSAIQAAVGADITFSSELQLELAAGAGPAFGGGEGASFSARGDAVLHFVLDPQHRMRWSPYAGGGMGARHDRTADWRAVAILVVGVTGPPKKHLIPFVEAGLGGGFRIGAGLRRAR